jgi:putative FmdB family regulatory protein
MPIYEFRCAVCNAKSSLFFRSFTVAEEARNSNNLACQRCGSKTLTKVFSRFALGRSAAKEGEEIYEFDRMMGKLDEDDPQSVARWAKEMGSELGEEVGSEFQEAMGRIGDGESPETVIGEIDSKLGGNEEN